MKILYFGDCSQGAMGILNRDIKNTLDRTHPEIQFDLLDSYDIFLNQKRWKNYDLIIIDPYYAHEADATNWHFSPEEYIVFKSKLIPIYHASLDIPGLHFNQEWFENWFTTPVCGINIDIIDEITVRGVESQLLPIGVSKEKFKPFKEVKKIKKIGFVGNADQSENEEWAMIKRPALFKEICEKASVEYVVISGKDHGRQMYEDVDAIICTSISEGNPMSFLEAAACKIPFISVNVGIVKNYKEVKTFETIDDAIAIIDYLNESEDNIKEYTNNVYGELFPDREWEDILEKHWIPYFNKLVNKNKKIKIIPHLFHRDDIGKYLTSRGLTNKGVEVGALKGEFSKRILSTWPGTLYMIDPWRHLEDDTEDASYHISNESYLDTIKNIRGHETRGFMLRGRGEELVDLFEDNSLDYVYIDGNHAYAYVKADMELWYPKLKNGGLFSGHNYLSIDWSIDIKPYATTVYEGYNIYHEFCDNGKDQLITPDWGPGPCSIGTFGINPAVDEFCKKYNKNVKVTDEFWGTWHFIK